MNAIRHIVGIPTATEQRCVRCCGVIESIIRGAACWFPGTVVSTPSSIGADGDCVQVDSCRAEETLEGAIDRTRTYVEQMEDAEVESKRHAARLALGSCR